MDILLLANRPTANSQAYTVTEYLDAFSDYSEHQIFEISMMKEFPKNIDLNRFDVVILHYSLSIGPMIEHYLGLDLISKLEQFKGLKIAFLQDEYRAIQTYWKHIRQLDLDILFSCVPDNQIEKVYPQQKFSNLKVVNVLTGYVSKTLLDRNVPKIADRSIDVGYRSRKPPFWLGELGWDKHLIASEFTRLAQSTNLKINISNNEGDRLYGKDWTNFILSCRALLGTESGASIIDFDGKLEAEVDKYVVENPQSSFEEVSELFLKDFEGSLQLHQISPRCFEAAALKTPMVLFEGFYSGILTPDRHFIPLKRDFSNFKQVEKKLKDIVFLQEMAERTYLEIACDPRWSYAAFLKKVDSEINAAVELSSYSRTINPYSQKQFSRAVRSSLGYYFRRKQAMLLQYLFLGFPLARKALFGLWFKLPANVQKIVRPFARIISR